MRHPYCPPFCLLAVAAIAVMLAGASALGAESKPTAQPAAAPVDTSAAEAASYSAGLQVGEGMHRAGLSTEIDVNAFARGLKDALAGKATTPEDRDRVTRFVADTRNSIATRNRTAAREFLAKNGKAPGVVTTASGLQYKVIQAGDAKAAAPQPTDQVTVNYRGKLLDGTEFDSSYTRGTPATFPLTGVIKGWQEALVLMKPGAKWQLAIPPELAYDMNSRPPIPPGSLLLFDVELLKINSPASE